MALQRILAATDLEEKTDAALRHAALLATELGAELVVTHVLHSSELGIEEGTHRPGRLGDAALDRSRQAVMAQLTRAAIDAEGVIIDVRFGDPGLDVISSAVEHGCALIVITVESRSKLGKLLMGSHAQQILLDSPIPVVGVKPNWSQPQ